MMAIERALVTPSFIIRGLRSDPRRRVERRRHRYPTLVLIHAGGFAEQGPFSPGAEAGEALIYPGDSEHTVDVGSEGLVCLLVAPRPHWLAQKECRTLFAAPRVLRSRIVRACTARVVGLARRFGEGSPGTEFSDRLAAEGQVTDLLAQLLRRESPHPGGDWLRKIYLKIASDPLHRWSLAELSALVGRHPVHLARAFRERYGESIGQFFRRVRMDRCRALLAQGRRKLADLAHEAGFADQSHFMREYRKLYGHPPGDGRCPHCGEKAEAD